LKVLVRKEKDKNNWAKPFVSKDPGTGR